MVMIIGRRAGVVLALLAGLAVAASLPALSSGYRSEGDERGNVEAQRMPDERGNAESQRTPDDRVNVEAQRPHDERGYAEDHRRHEERGFGFHILRQRGP